VPLRPCPSPTYRWGTSGRLGDDNPFWLQSSTSSTRERPITYSLAVLNFQTASNHPLRLAPQAQLAAN